MKALETRIHSRRKTHTKNQITSTQVRIELARLTLPRRVPKPATMKISIWVLAQAKSLRRGLRIKRRQNPPTKSVVSHPLMSLRT